MGSNLFNLGVVQQSAEIQVFSERQRQTVDSNGFVEHVTSDSLEISVEFEQLEARLQRMNRIDGLEESAQLLLQKASMNVTINFQRVDRFIELGEEVGNISPDLLKEYLAVIKLLDERTPESLDPFFDRLEEAISKIETSESVAVEQLQSFFVSVRIDVFGISISQEEQIQLADPLMLDLDDDGLELSDLENGFLFDITGDGRKERISRPLSNDVFLSWDRNKNGKIDSGLELFGDQHGAADGYQELSKFDGNADGMIDNKDQIFAELSLFNGKRMISLESSGIESLSLAMKQINQIAGKNIIASTSQFTRQNGSSGTIADVLLAYR
jgi:hypothetical protein